PDSYLRTHVFSLARYGAHRELHSFPTRRSSDLGRLTREGRKVMDGIDGLRLYLELAEKDRMALAGAPRMSPSHYETLLPYAVALDRKSTRLNSSHVKISYAVFCLKKKKTNTRAA